MSDTAAEIKEMARLTMLSNRLNPIQERNLKMYPLVFFEGVIKATMEFDLSCRPDSMDTTETYVKYHVLIDDNQQITDREYRIKSLRDAVRTLFWSNLKVEVEITGGQDGE